MHGSWLHLVVENLLNHGVLDHVNLLKIAIHTAAGCFQDGSVFACYVDGAHDLDAVSNDIKAWWPKIRVGGYLSGHDWNQQGVRAAVTELSHATGVPIMNHGPSVWIIQKPGLP